MTSQLDKLQYQGLFLGTKVFKLLLNVWLNKSNLMPKLFIIIINVSLIAFFRQTLC